MAAPSLALIPSAYKVGEVASVKPMDGKGDFTFTRNSEATRIGSSGLIETMSVDVPRIDHSDGGCPSLLLEPVSTNLIPYSEDITSNSTYGISGIVNASGYLSPTGDANGYLATESIGIEEHYLTFGVSSATTNKVVTSSFFIKPNGRDKIRITNYMNLANQLAWVEIDLSDNSLINSASSNVAYTSYSVVDYPDGWKRVALTTTKTGSTYAYNVRLNFLNNAGDLSYLGNGINGAYIFGVQQEHDSSYATSYIPTNGTVVTRASEVCGGAGDVTTFNSTEGVLFVEMAALSDDLSYRILSLSNGTSNERVYMQYTNASNTIAVVVKEDGNTQANMSYVLSDEVAFSKIAIKWKVNDFALWVNGSERATDTSGDTPIGLNSLQFDDGNSVNNFYGKVKQLQVFKTALTDAELIALTTL